MKYIKAQSSRTYEMLLYRIEEILEKYQEHEEISSLS